MKLHILRWLADNMLIKGKGKSSGTVGNAEFQIFFYATVFQKNFLK